MICRDCQCEFSAYEDVDCFDGTVREGAMYGGSAARCPSCGSEDVEERSVCKHCEQEVASAMLEDGLCEACVEETRESLAWLLGSLTPPQRRWAIGALKREE